ncbi:50S ribosomal protein L6 [Candidatus Berkelbacteria bacterium CG10_big_fil_rev_8_21_14_0_10_43_13]|uniref:50S ribosomal protein L6 n=1 Tax=Candidatus Berkelbacteria bacterium CG10_big_fil_rev_8_21_14_0_10_43_13 TaxID=1974514 RepID=A0A2H0W6B6_9BACT|nr:MAG: 50S ribosomal protein L6 [Candidatus Berkelbacteria bacterium CG10_big_fil_rev_8_21_14_0_10_43_13]
MSKIAKKPILLTEGVNAEIIKNHLTVSSGEKKLELDFPREISLETRDGGIYVVANSETKFAREQHGLIARLVSNMVTGVRDGFTKELVFKGTGYRVAVDGRDVKMAMGYSHDIKLHIPEDLEVKVVKNSITVSGIDKAAVGQFAAIIREVRKPEVYKGKGIKYIDEHIRRKAGKTAASK